MSKFDPILLLPEKERKPYTDKIAIFVADGPEAKIVNQLAESAGAGDLIVGVYPGMALQGMRFKRAYYSQATFFRMNMPFDQFTGWFDNQFRCRCTPDAGIVDASHMLSFRQLFKFVIENDAYIENQVQFPIDNVNSN